jgi:hypothetical protein
MSFARGWWSAWWRCIVIRIGLKDVLKVDVEEHGNGGDDSAD